MRDWVLNYLYCPQCGSKLVCDVYERADDGHIMTGVLTSDTDDCSAWYPIIRGVPRLLEESLRVEATRQFVEQYSQMLEVKGLSSSGNIRGQSSLQDLKLHTIQNFGFEWTEYSRHGWDDPVYNIQSEEAIFGNKSLLQPQDLEGNLVLDAGCGNGRYTYWSAKYGGQVIGVDLGDGVDAAFANTRHLPNVTIVQGDIFKLPFLEQTFNVIFSIGVLMHTGDAHKATKSLADKLKVGGSITVHVYGKGNPVYEFVDTTLRKRTTKMSIEQLQTFTHRAYNLRRIIDKVRLAKLLQLVVRLESHPHCIFDWYAAPIASHHTHEEVRSWFDALALKIITTNESGPPKISTGLKAILRDIHRALRPGMITVRGIRQS